MQSPRPLISVVAPCLNERECVPLFVAAVRDILDRETYDLEIVLVDDGSTDGTWDCICEAADADARVRGVRLSRNFGHDAAITAGMDAARGDAIITMDADLQHPPAMIPKLLAAWTEGADVVLGVRQHTPDASVGKRTTSAAYYWLLNRLGGIRLEPNAPDFRLVSRQVADALKQCGERARLVRGLITWLGFSVVTVPFDAAPRAAGESKFTPFKMMHKGLTGLLAFSTVPLRVATLLGFTVVVFSLLYFLVAMYAFVTGADTVRGWTSLIATVLLLGGMQLLCIGILGEYIARTFEEVKARPIYVVRDLADRAGGGTGKS